MERRKRVSCSTFKNESIECKKKDESETKASITTTSNWDKVHSKLCDIRDKGTPILLKIQKFRRPFLDSYFKFADFCGEELFFLISLPFNAWNGVRIGLHGAFLISVIAFGNYFKNILQVKRPSHPELWNPGNKQKSDHGLPSTHTMSALTYCLYLLIYHYVDKAEYAAHYPISFWTALAIASFYAGNIIFSRLYLGYHSLLDVACGLILGLFYWSFFYFFFRHLLDAWVCVDYPYSFTLTFLIGAAIMAFHPRPSSPTPVWAESGVCIGTATGSTLGVLLLSTTKYSDYIGPISLIDPSSFVGQIRAHRLYFLLARLVVGSCVVALVRTLSKSIFTRVFFLVLWRKSSTNRKSHCSSQIFGLLLCWFFCFHFGSYIF